MSAPVEFKREFVLRTGLDAFHGGLDLVQEGLGFGECIRVRGDFFEGGVEEDFELGLQGEDGVVCWVFVLVLVRVLVLVLTGRERVWFRAAGWVEGGYC